MRICQHSDSHLVGVHKLHPKCLPQWECTWKRILCVHKGKTDWVTTQVTLAWTQALRVPKAENCFSCRCTSMLCVIFGCNHGRKHWQAFLLLAELEKITSKLNKKALLELKAMLCQSKSWKFLFSLVAWLTQLLPPYQSPAHLKECQRVRKSDHVLPVAGSVQL